MNLWFYSRSELKSDKIQQIVYKIKHVKLYSYLFKCIFLDVFLSNKPDSDFLVGIPFLLVLTCASSEGHPLPRWQAVKTTNMAKVSRLILERICIKKYSILRAVLSKINVELLILQAFTPIPVLGSLNLKLLKHKIFLYMYCINKKCNIYLWCKINH